MLTVRATTLESYRLYRDPDLDFISTEEMEARLLGVEWEPDEGARARMGRGTAFHDAVATGVPNDRDLVIVDDYTFAAVSVRAAREGLNGAVAEAEGSTVIDVDGVPVRLTGHADWLRGLDLWDLKTSDKPIPADRHADSMQWRAYVLIFGVERVTYRHVQFADVRNDVICVRSVDDVVLYPYPKLLDDVVACLRDLLAFARLRGCLDAMEEADEEAA